MSLPDTETMLMIGGALVAFLTGTINALRVVAPHTETKLDDKAVELGEKALPLMVRLLNYFRK